MTIRMSGMVSGMDTESLVSAMVSTYVSKKEKYQKAQTKLSYKQDAWKALNTKVYSLYSSISSLRFSSAYSMKKTTVSDATKACGQQCHQWYTESADQAVGKIRLYHRCQTCQRHD